MHRTDRWSRSSTRCPTAWWSSSRRRARHASNPCAPGLLPRAGRGAAPTRCDELLDCRRPAGRARRAAWPSAPPQREGPLPEIRIDTRSRRRRQRAVGDRRAARRRPRAVLHLRPGDARDRRRRSDPHWISGPRLRIAAFGRMHVDSPEGPLGGKWLQQRPGHVLKYLVCERNRVVHAEEIAEALWPDAGPAALNNVRHFIHALRDKLEPDRPKRAPLVVHRRRPGRLRDRPPAVQIDADDFEEAAKKGVDAARARLRRPRRETELREGARALPRRLPGRRALRRVGLRGARPPARADHAVPATARDDPRQARRHRRRGGACSSSWPSSSPTTRRSTASCSPPGCGWGGAREAARRYTAFRMRMLREFGEEPDFELADLTVTAARARVLSKRQLSVPAFVRSFMTLCGQGPICWPRLRATMS